MSAAPVRLARAAGRRPISVSFEFFPPKSADMETELWECIRRLEPLAPRFVSVTYGAGGSTRERTHSTVRRIVEETTLAPAAHLTCVGASCREVDEVVHDYWAAGVRHIVALRGDPTTGLGTTYVPHPEGYATSADLIEGIRRIGDFEVTVSAYPERHPESTSFKQDIEVLKRKVGAGATRAITQFFFYNDLYFRFLDQARAAGIDIPILPGILPVQNFKRAAFFAEKCGASVPASLAERFEGLDEDPLVRRLVAAAVCAEQVIDLVDRGVTDLHFYTMNKADLCYAICHLVGLRPHAEDGVAKAAA